MSEPSAMLWQALPPPSRGRCSGMKAEAATRVLACLAAPVDRNQSLIADTRLQHAHASRVPSIQRPGNRATSAWGSRGIDTLPKGGDVGRCR